MMAELDRVAGMCPDVEIFLIFIFLFCCNTKTRLLP